MSNMHNPDVVHQNWSTKIGVVPQNFAKNVIPQNLSQKICSPEFEPQKIADIHTDRVKNITRNPLQRRGKNGTNKLLTKHLNSPGKREHNAHNARKRPKNYKLGTKPHSYRELCDHTAFSRRARHDLSMLMAFLLRSMGLATVITGDPAAISPRSWGSYHASSTCIVTARRPQGASITFSRPLYKLVRLFEKCPDNHCVVILHNKHLV